MPLPEYISRLASIRSRVAGRLATLYLQGVSKTLRRLGYRISPSALSYFKAEEVISAAKKQRLTVPEYCEEVNLGHVGKRKDYIINQLLVGHSIDCGGYLLEIGSGTCMFPEKITEAVQPSLVEIYEPDEGWRRYAKARMSELSLDVVAWRANGCSLDCTDSECVDTVFAHGVFVCDAFLAGDSIFSTVKDFRVSNPPGYNFPVFLHRSWIDEAAQSLGFKIEASFTAPYHGIETTYIIFRKQSSCGSV